MILLLSVDIANIGRVNPSTLSDQQLMELFFTPKDYESTRRELEGDEDNACTWRGVRCTGSNEVTLIDWHRSDLEIEGSIDFRMLRPLLLRLNLYCQPLTGEVDMSALPTELVTLCIQSCHLTGTLDLGNLPKTLQELFFT